MFDPFFSSVRLTTVKTVAVDIRGKCLQMYLDLHEMQIFVWQTGPRRRGHPYRTNEISIKYTSESQKKKGKRKKERGVPVYEFMNSLSVVIGNVKPRDRKFNSAIENLCIFQRNSLVIPLEECHGVV